MVWGHKRPRFISLGTTNKAASREICISLGWSRQIPSPDSVVGKHWENIQSHSPTELCALKHILEVIFKERSDLFLLEKWKRITSDEI